MNLRKLLLALALLPALLWSGGARAEWREASTRHFLIYSEQNERDLRRFAESLERFDRVLRRFLGRSDPDRSPSARVTIYVLPTISGLQRFLGGAGVAGVYMPRVSGSTIFTTRRGDRASRPEDQVRELTPEIVLLHEYTHHFLFNNFAFGAPLWFSEGYPEFWSTVRFSDDGSVQVGIPAWHRNAELTIGRPMHVRELLTLRMPVRDAETGVVVYGRGWLLNHYLNFTPSRQGQLNAYLRALNERRSPDEAAAVFGDLNQLNTELNRYLRNPRFNSVTIPAGEVPPGEVNIRVLRPGEQAVMDMRMQSKRGVNREQALALVPQVRRAAAAHTNDAIAQVTLAEAEYDAGNFNEAEAAADRAIAADPRLVDAHLYKARAIWGRLEAAQNRDAAAWAAVRAHIAAANRIDPDDPEPLVAFYESFKPAGQRPTTNAVQGLLSAHAEAPEDRQVRLAAGRELLRSGDGDRARAVLAPFSGDSHAGELGTVVAEVLTKLASDGAAPASQLLESKIEEMEREARERTRRRG